MWKILTGLLLLVLVTAGLYAINYSEIMRYPVSTEDKQVSKTVKVAEVEFSTAGTRLPLVGRVHARRSVKITSEVAARVSKVLVAPTQAVKEGDLLIQMDNVRHLALLEEAVIVLKNYQRKLSMSKKLVSKGVISQDAYDQIVSQVQTQQAVVDARKAELDSREITAPFSGILSLHDLTVGQLVKPGDLLVQLDDLSQVYVDFSIPERFLSKVVVGQEVTAVTDAWPNYIFRGKIKQINTNVDTDTLSVGVRIYFDNQELKLLDGMMLEVSLTLAASKYPVIPLKSIVYSGDDRYVYVVSRENKVFKRKVTLGTVNGSMVAVTHGLREGTLIAVEGVGKLHDGDTVIVKKQDTKNVLDGEVPLRKKDRNQSKDQML